MDKGDCYANLEWENIEELWCESDEMEDENKFHSFSPLW
jgi:hypothetical protein